MKDMAQIEDKSFSFRHKFLVKINNLKSAKCSTRTASFFDPRMWDTILKNCQHTNSLKVFKK